MAGARLTVAPPPVSAAELPPALAAAAALGLLAGRGRLRALLALLPLALAAFLPLAGGSDAAEGPPQPAHDAKALAPLFEPFKADGVAVRADGDYFYIESNAFPGTR